MSGESTDEWGPGKVASGTFFIIAYRDTIGTAYEEFS